MKVMFPESLREPNSPFWGKTTHIGTEAMYLIWTTEMVFSGPSPAGEPLFGGWGSRDPTPEDFPRIDGEEGSWSLHSLNHNDERGERKLINYYKYNNII